MENQESWKDIKSLHDRLTETEMVRDVYTSLVDNLVQKARNACTQKHTHHAKSQPAVSSYEK